MREYRKRNPKFMAAHIAKLRALKLGNTSSGHYSPKEWRELKDAYGNVCLCCKGIKPLEADHVIPLTRGGSNTIDNIQPLCRSCNSKKYMSFYDYRLDWT